MTALEDELLYWLMAQRDGVIRVFACQTFHCLLAAFEDIIESKSSELDSLRFDCMRCFTNPRLYA